MSNPKIASFKNVMPSLQQSLDTWEGSLKATCSAIVPEKTFWQLTKSFPTIGVGLVPDCSAMRQAKKMKELAVKWADAMCTGKLQKIDVLLAITSTIW
jgi:hypothetical protein